MTSGPNKDILPGQGKDTTKESIHTFLKGLKKPYLKTSFKTSLEEFQATIKLLRREGKRWK